MRNISDDVDRQVLPIFLEEAAELFPQAGEQLRAWRKKPADATPVRGLKRTLHTFKGSARMAGAMRLGELTHLMENRLPEGDAMAHPAPALLDALDTDLDRIAFVLDRLHKGEFNTVLPWLDAEAVAAAALDDAVSKPAAKAPVVATLPLASSAPTAAATATSAQEAEGARAQLRVRADLIDRLVNEAGEVAIARARVEGRAAVAQVQPIGIDRERHTACAHRFARSRSRPIRKSSRECRWSTRPRKVSIRWNSTASRASRN